MKRLLLVLLLLAPFAGAVTETVVFNFDGSNNGNSPNQNNWILPSTCTANTAYGTVVVNGNFATPGKIFSLDTSNNYTVIASGQIPNGGPNPNSPLVEDANTCALYGVTSGGSLYKLTYSGGTWTTTNLGSPGSDPGGQLVRFACAGQTNHTCIYGTSQYGGTNNSSGTLWKFDENTGSFTTLYNFGASSTDATHPASGVTTKSTTGRVLYGTSTAGGANGTGTVWSYDLNNSVNPYTVIYSFLSSSADGSAPQAVPYFDGPGNMY